MSLKLVFHLRVRGDQGVENLDMANFMFATGEPEEKALSQERASTIRGLLVFSLEFFSLIIISC